jgi:hypothetical protein
MKGANPFIAAGGAAEDLAGRKEEFGMLSSLLNSTGAGQGLVLVVKGGPGMGKSALLSAFRAEAEKNGMLAPFVRCEKGEDARSVAGRLCHDAAMLSGTEARKLPADFPALVRAMGAMAGKRHFGAVLFLDDIDVMRKAESQPAGMAKALAGSKISFVAATTRELGRGAGEAIRLVELKPLDDHEAGEFIGKALGKGPPKMGEECMRSIMADVQGNPRLLREVCRLVYEKVRDNEKVISKGHYLAYLPYIMSMLSREWFGRMYQETPPSERAMLAVLAGEEGGMHVSDVARKLGKPLGPVTALMKRLLDSGQVVRLDRGKYRVFSKLYARYVAQRG